MEGTDMANITRETVDSKAYRLQSQVTWLTATVAQVQGDNAAYLVDRLTGTWRCNCPWGARRSAHEKYCSHVLAAALSAADATPALTAPVSPAVATPAAPPAAAAAVERTLAEQANGKCSCAHVASGDLYFNRSQATVIHRLCGRAWTSEAIAPAAQRKSPVRIAPAAPAVASQGVA
jgi:hypothetical protein